MKIHTLQGTVIHEPLIHNVDLDVIKSARTKEFYTFIYEWISKYGKQALKIGAGEIAILIELLDANSQSLSGSDFRKLFDPKIFSQSSLYKKINFLHTIDFISLSAKMDQRKKYYMITINGIEFIKSAFSSLNF